MNKDPAIVAYLRIEEILNNAIRKGSRHLKDAEYGGKSGVSVSVVTERERKKRDPSSKRRSRRKKSSFSRDKNNLPKDPMASNKSDRSRSSKSMSSLGNSNNSDEIPDISVDDHPVHIEPNVAKKSEKKIKTKHSNPFGACRKVKKSLPPLKSRSAIVVSNTTSDGSRRSINQSFSMCSTNSRQEKFRKTKSKRPQSFMICSKANGVNMQVCTKKSSRSKGSSFNSKNSSTRSGKSANSSGRSSRSNRTTSGNTTDAEKNDRVVFYAEDGKRRIEVIPLDSEEEKSECSKRKPVKSKKTKKSKTKMSSSNAETKVSMEEVDPLASAMSDLMIYKSGAIPRPQKCPMKSKNCPRSSNRPCPRSECPLSQTNDTVLSEPQMSLFCSELLILDGDQRCQLNIRGNLVEDVLKKLSLNGNEYRI